MPLLWQPYVWINGAGGRDSILDLFDVMALGVALGADSLSVSIGIGMGGVKLARACKLAGLFGGMQGALLALGAGLATWLHWFLDAAALYPGLIGRFFAGLNVLTVHRVIHCSLSLVGAGILCIVGTGLIRSYLTRAGNERPVYYHGRLALLLLALSVSIDAFSAGVGLGMLEGHDLTEVCVPVALVIAVLALVGLKAGRRIGAIIGRKAEPVGGGLLIALALHLVLQTI